VYVKDKAGEKMNLEVASLLASLLVGLITIYVNFRVESVRNHIAVKTASVNSEVEFREDLMDQIKAQGERIVQQEKDQRELRELMIKKQEENLQLRLDKMRLENRVIELVHDLNEFNRRVYFVDDERKS
jgi:hypothetical protein